MPKLMIVVGSVRQGRIGLPIAEWLRREAEADGRFEVDFVDLAELALPLMDEPNHPRLGRYTHDHTIAWSRRVDAADAFLFAFPEYNHSYSPAIKNALDYLHAEWGRKPVGFANWGGHSAGTRAQAALRPVVAVLGMVPTRANVEINHPREQLSSGPDGDVFEPDEHQRGVVRAQLDELAALDAALRPLRG